MTQFGIQNQFLTPLTHKGWQQLPRFLIKQFSHTRFLEQWSIEAEIVGIEGKKQTRFTTMATWPANDLLFLWVKSISDMICVVLQGML